MLMTSEVRAKLQAHGATVEQCSRLETLAASKGLNLNALLSLLTLIGQNSPQIISAIEALFAAA